MGSEEWRILVHSLRTSLKFVTLNIRYLITQSTALLMLACFVLKRWLLKSNGRNGPLFDLLINFDNFTAIVKMVNDGLGINLSYKEFGSDAQ